MLENYSSLLSLGHCIPKPAVVFKLEQGQEPWTLEELSSQSLPDIQKIDDMVERSQENQGKRFWQVVITNNKTTEKVELGKTFNLSTTLFPLRKVTCGMSSNHISKLIINNGNYSGIKPTDFKVCKNLLLPVNPDRMHAGEKPYDLNLFGKSLRQNEQFIYHQNIQTFEYSGQGKAFNKEAIFFTGKSDVEKKPSKSNEYGKTCDESALIVQEITQVGENQYKCKEYRKTSCDKTTLFNPCRAHVEVKHHKCNQSENDFTQFQGTHSGERTFECNVWGKTFCKKSNLTKHQKAHTGEKLYKCIKCGKAFTGKSTLTVHQRTHTGEKPYACNECEKSFCHKSDLTVHQKIQTGEKPYGCNECG
ncbi:zinc finger protein 33B-like [Choloepus didactylus]|uniref:zinc finger protein 33B-like n=1 Tax=Choloepus didactylus TaxID=27675 RepID=UPI00189FA7DE|nr:zinc finger protein 33B-like [Choloepus didactylus]